MTKPHRCSSERFSSSCTRLCGLLRAAPATPARRVVEIDAAADEVDRRVLPEMGDRVALAIDLNGFGDGQAAVAQFLEERQQPAFARERRSRSLFQEASPWRP